MKYTAKIQTISGIIVYSPARGRNVKFISTLATITDAKADVRLRSSISEQPNPNSADRIAKTVNVRPEYKYKSDSNVQPNP